MVRVGDPAPDFTLESDSGQTMTLSALRGRPVVVYFYPKDETSGCTTQACDIRDSWDEFERMGATVVGISPDSAESHAGFRAHHKLPFPLLVDADHAVAEAYGAWGEKKNYGRTYMGIIRSGFVVDAAGRLAAVKHNVKADRHREWALAELGKLADGAHAA
jgi:thioredoxin-dependent peroxiredoxin